MTKLRALKSALLLTCAVMPGVASAQSTLPTIEVVGVAPLSGGAEIDKDKVPSNVLSIGAADLSSTKSSSLLDGMVQYLPGVSLSDQSGNQFQRNLDYRGFTASPVPGTPQGIAVYQNGSRINEAFGDVVNWDLIPQMAIARMTLMPNNPLFGLNATGGALSIEMKNGFTYHGTEAELWGGSYGRITGGAQSGYQDGNVAAYVAADSTYDRGWRDFSSSSQVRRMYVDVGARGDQTEWHVSFTGADNKLGSVAGTPIEMLNQRWSSVYTWPQYDASSTRLPAGQRQVDADGHLDGAGQRLLPRLSRVPYRRQWHATRRPAMTAVRSPDSSASVTVRRRSIRTVSHPISSLPIPRSARSTATRPARTAMAARCRRPRPTSCSGMTTISSSAPASITAARISRPRPNSARST